MEKTVGLTLGRSFIPDIDLEENKNEPYIPFFRYLLSKPNSELPQVISLSYGDIEDVGAAPPSSTR